MKYEIPVDIRGRRELENPVSIALYGDDVRLVADSEGESVVVFDDRGRWLRTLGYPDNDGNVEFDELTDVEADKHGRIWVCDIGEDRVVRINLTGQLQLSIGGKGARKGFFKKPGDIALDRRGRVYVADTGNRRVQVFSPDGDLLDVWRGAHGYGRNKIVRPVRLAYSAEEDGYLWVANEGSGKLEKFELDGKWKETLDLGALLDTQVIVADMVFYQPFERLVVLDAAANRVLVVGEQGDLKAQLDLPPGVVGSAVQVEGTMDILVADAANGKVLFYRRGN